MWEKAKTIQDYIVGIRRELHQIPEIGIDLPKTRAVVLRELDNMGIEYVCSNIDSSVVATIKGNPGKIVALRGDMDALKIIEKNDVDYISKHPGCMHGCGHDAHTAMLLGTAKILNENKTELNGTVKLLFQTGEEISKGAKIIVKEGHLDDVDAVFGIHIGSILGPNIKTGTLIAVPGNIMASFDRFIIKVKGIGCHGSTPEKGIDPINIASHIVLSTQEILARELPATQPAVVTFGKFCGGDVYNVIPSEVELEGTIRALDQEVREKIVRRIDEIAVGVAKTFGGEIEFEMDWGAPPVVNDDAMALLAGNAAKEALGEDYVITEVDKPNMGGEDFAYYLEKVPGAFMFLSSANAAKHTDGPHHNPHFNIDEDVLYRGPATFVSIVENFLK